MARNKCKGTRLKVFSGKEASLNRVICKILDKKGQMIAYDMWLLIKQIKGIRHVDYRTVYRRMGSLQDKGWIAEAGTRITKPGWDSTLYKLTLRGKAALKLDGKSLENFLATATDEQLNKLIDALSD